MKHQVKTSKPKTAKIIAVSAITVILGVTCLFTLGRNKYYYIDNVTNETYTSLYHWFWEKAEDNFPALFHELDDGSGIRATGIKKTKSGFGVFAKTEYEIIFEEAKFNIHYVLGEDENGKFIEAEDTYTYSGIEDQPLRFDFENAETSAGKRIIGWKIDDKESAEVYTSIPAGSYGDVHAFPVYSDEVVENTTADETETEISDEDANLATVEPEATEEN